MRTSGRAVKRRRTSTRRRPALLRNPGWQLRVLKRLQAMGGARRRNPKPDPHFGTSLTDEEVERVQSLLEDGFTVMLTPLADQVVIATVDLDKLMSLIGDPRASLH